MELAWEESSLVRFVTKLGSCSWGMWFDPLGSGSSDAPEEIDGATPSGRSQALGCCKSVDVSAYP